MADNKLSGRSRQATRKVAAERSGSQANAPPKRTVTTAAGAGGSTAASKKTVSKAASQRNEDKPVVRRSLRIQAQQRGISSDTSRNSTSQATKFETAAVNAQPEPSGVSSNRKGDSKKVETGTRPKDKKPAEPAVRAPATRRQAKVQIEAPKPNEGTKKQLRKRTVSELSNASTNVPKVSKKQTGSDAKTGKTDRKRTITEAKSTSAVAKAGAKRFRWEITNTGAGRTRRGTRAETNPPASVAGNEIATTGSRTSKPSATVSVAPSSSLSSMESGGGSPCEGGSGNNIPRSPNSGGGAAANPSCLLQSVSSTSSNDWLIDDEEMAHLQNLLESRGLSSHRLAAFGSRMYSLVQRSFGTSNGVKAQQLLEGLQAKHDEGQQMQAVMEICEMLLMGNEDTLVGFPAKQMIPALVSLLSMEHNFDMMHHASRALTYMLDSLPRSSSFMVDAIPVFVEKLQSINCMDVAEQSLKALEILSRRHSKAIIDAGGVMACLQFLDFFSMDARRSALAITANCCACISPQDYSRSIKPLVPILTACLENQDKKSLESVCYCFSRLVENCRPSQEILSDLGNATLLVNVQRVLIVTPPVIATNTFIMVIRMLSTLCCCCPKLAVDLLNHNIAETLCFLLTGSNDSGGEDVELVSRSPQELTEITSLITELMPPLPTDGVFSINKFIRDNTQRSLISQRIAERLVMSSMVAGLSDDRLMLSTDRLVSPPGDHNSNPVVSMLQEDNPVAINFIRCLFSMLHKVYASSAGPAVRYKCLQALLRMIYYSKVDLLKEILSFQGISSQIATMLASLDLRVIVGALQLADVLLEKMPDAFHVYFHRQGVMHQIMKLADKNVSLGTSMPEENEVIRPESPDSSMSYVSSSSSSASSSPRIKLENRYEDDPLEAPLPDFPPPPPLNLSSLESFTPDSRYPLRYPLLRSNETASSLQESTSRYSCYLPGLSSTSNQYETLHSSVRSALGAGSPPVTSPPDSTDSGVSQSLIAAVSASLMSACPDPINRCLSSSTKSTDKSTNKQEEKSSGTATASGSAQMRLSDLLKRKKHPKRLTNATASATAPGGKKASLDDESTSTASIYVPPKINPEELPAVDPILPSVSSSPPAASSIVTIKTETSNFGGTSLVPGNAEKEKIETWIREQAVRLKKAYFGGETHPAMDVLNRLMTAINALETELEPSVQALKEIAGIVSNSDISAFEVNHSGLVSAFLKYLSKSDQPMMKTPPLQARIYNFLHVFLSVPLDQRVDVAVPANPPLSGLVTKLQACVNQLEQFPVRVHELPSGVGSIRSGINPIMQFFNTHQIKCQFQRHTQGGNLREWQGGPVKVDPFALVHTVERYLVGRGYGEKLSPGTAKAETPTERSGRLQLLINDQVLPHNMTMYQAIRQFANGCGGGKPGSSQFAGSGLLSCNVWAQTHTIYYRQHSAIASEGSGSSTLTPSSSRVKKSSSPGSKSEKKSDAWWNQGTPPPPESPIIPFLKTQLPDEVTVQDASLEVIALLRILHRLNNYWGELYRVGNYKPGIPNQEFVNSKLAVKANRQLFDPLVIMTSSLPVWLNQLPKSCPFLFPFDTRQMLLHTVAFDRDRALQHLLDTVPDLSASSNPNERITPRLERKKKVVSRKNILQQAEAVFHDLGSPRCLLEIQYENEAGTGLGPTLEFYALVSKELQRSTSEMWRNSPSDSAEYSYSTNGLYAQPIGRHAKSTTIKALRSKFKFLGKFMAKALMDSRMVDVPLSKTFYKWLSGEEKSLELSDFFVIDPEFANSFAQLKKVVWQKSDLLAQNQNLTEELKGTLTVNGTSIEDLGFDFTLPGYNGIELKKYGKNVSVKLENVEDYLNLVQFWSLYQGVHRQMEAFREGFESILSLSHLQLFYPDEMDLLFCGVSFESWNVKYLMEVTKTDHGYTHDSRAVKFLFTILSNYDAEHQRKFIHFLTGSPRLPVGGFRSLSPRFTIVCKTFEEFENPDDYLPSVMTCVNYLKLPDYSTIEVMQLKLQQAVEDGCHTFHLS